MKDGKYEAGDFTQDVQRHPIDAQEIADVANALLPSILKPLEEKLRSAETEVGRQKKIVEFLRQVAIDFRGTKL